MICLKGVQTGISALAGAFSYAIPTFLFLWRLGSYAGAQALTKFMLTFFIGEALKLIVCGFSFLILIKYCHVNLIDAFFGLCVAIVAFWISSVMSLSSKGAKS
jgi:F0F1-type ATP synthase assembly protein I